MGMKDDSTLAPWLPFTDDKTFVIPRDKILVITQADEHISHYYEVILSKVEKARAIVENETNAIIVASYGTFSTGINIKNLHNIIFASPSKSRIRNLQSIGRGLRLGDNKVNATLYDIADDLQYKSKENFTLKHFQERINIYNEEEFDYEIHNINLKD